MTAEIIVDRIIEDLTSRRGFRQAWEEIDDDIKEEIRDTWIEIVRSECGSGLVI